MTTDYPILNESETGYLLGRQPWPGKQFEGAMSFHDPEGLAAVHDETGAYHLNLDGRPAYTHRFHEASGFYEGIAAVQDERGWFHIHPNGKRLHDRCFHWSGNFQGRRCVVQDNYGFFHITLSGSDAYSQRFRYTGDFRYGIAVAFQSGGAFHIRPDGSPLHQRTYVHADPFHKGFAVVADEEGFFHVDLSGKPLGNVRFNSAEPFYNGFALCRDRDNELIRLRINGTWTRIARNLEPIDQVEIRQLIGKGIRIGLFLRHAERHPMTVHTPTWGNNILLTEKGKEQARSLGCTLLMGVVIGLWSSPIERCKQTCTAIAEGLGKLAGRVNTHQYLGDPGIYLDDTDAHVEGMRQDFHMFATGYLDRGVAPGMVPIPEASEKLIRFMREKMREAACTLFITHDFFSATLMSYLGLKIPDRIDWCDYLEGVCLVEKNDEIEFRRFMGKGGAKLC